MKLCAKHIMVSDLDGVVETTWLNNAGCNIFLIGENHKVHTKCTKITDMFERLINDEDFTSSLLDPSDRKIDLMLELSQDEAVYYTEKTDKDRVYKSDEADQIENVRWLFRDCVLRRVENNCQIRVHWTDPTSTTENKYDDRWLNKLYRSPLDLSASWANDPIIAAELNVENDIYKLITKNTKVVKEIRKATLKNEKFTHHFVMTIFEDEYDRLRRQFQYWDWKSIVGFLSRYVMDIYTVARIFSFKMKNVIIYAGNEHTIRIIRMLSELNFKTIKVVRGKEECAKLDD